jgi:predicted MPP superfamily phosphohydrolase
MERRSIPRLALLASLAATAALLACRTGAILDPAQQSQQPGVGVVDAAPKEPPTAFPNKDGSLKFVAFGDFGTGEPAQYQLAKQMGDLLGRFKYELVILLGDNLYGSERPQDFERKFEVPYKPLLDAGVKFKAALGNHDAREMRKYKHFDMQDKLFYSFKAPKQSVRFYALESTYMSPEQVAWIGDELKNTTDDWKIAFLHHALYSSARAHGSTDSLRESLEPLFIRYNVSAVFTGHDHVYERTKPQNGIVYFVVGSAGKLRPRDLNPRTGLTAKGFDTDLAFFAGEIDGDNMVFQAISRTGAIVDSGTLIRRKPARPQSLLPPSPVPPWAWLRPSPARTASATAPQPVIR